MVVLAAVDLGAVRILQAPEVLDPFEIADRGLVVGQLAAEAVVADLLLEAAGLPGTCSTLFAGTYAGRRIWLPESAELPQKSPERVELCSVSFQRFVLFN